MFQEALGYLYYNRDIGKAKDLILSAEHNLKKPMMCFVYKEEMEYELGVQYSLQCLDEAIESKDIVFETISRIASTYSLFFTNQLDEAWKMSEMTTSLLSNFTSLDNLQYNFWTMQYHSSRAHILGRRLKLDEALDEYLLAYPYANKMNTPYFRGYINYTIGNVYYAKRDYSKALEYYKSARDYWSNPNLLTFHANCLRTIAWMYRLQRRLKLARQTLDQAITEHRQLDDQKDLIYFYGSLAELTRDEGNITEAIRYLREALKLREIYPNIMHTARLNAGLANNYLTLGLVDRGIELLDEALISLLKLGNVDYISSIYEYRARAHELKGEYEKARLELNMSLDLQHQQGNKIKIGQVLMRIFMVEFNFKRFEEARTIFDNMVIISEKVDDIELELNCSIAGALLTKAQLSLRTSFESYKIFETLVNDPSMIFAQKLICLNSLADIVMSDYQLSQDPKLLIELKNLNDQLFEIGSQEGDVFVIIKSFLFNAYISHVQGNSEQAFNFIDQAIEQVDEKRLDGFSKLISEFYDIIAEGNNSKDTQNYFAAEISQLKHINGKSSLPYHAGQNKKDEKPIELFLMDLNHQIIFQTSLESKLMALEKHENVDLEIIHPQIGNQIKNSRNINFRFKIAQCTIFIRKYDRFISGFITIRPDFKSLRNFNLFSDILSIAIISHKVDILSVSAQLALRNNPIIQNLVNLLLKLNVLNSDEELELESTEMLSSSNSITDEIEIQNDLREFEDLQLFLKPERLAIMKMLYRYTRIVQQDLGLMMNLTKSKISRNIKLLRENGLIDVEYEFIETGPKSVIYLTYAGAEALTNFIHKINNITNQIALT